MEESLQYNLGRKGTRLENYFKAFPIKHTKKAEADRKWKGTHEVKDRQ